ncbi:hypothetical protein [Corynebacterium pyruviciproducens]
MKPRQTLTIGGIIRLVIYIISALIGLASVVVAQLGMVDLSTLLATVAGLTSAISGGTAAFSIKQKPGAPLDLAAIAAVIPALIGAVDAYRKAEPENTPPQVIGLPVYDQPTTNE